MLGRQTKTRSEYRRLEGWPRLPELLGGCGQSHCGLPLHRGRYVAVEVERGALRCAAKDGLQSVEFLGRRSGRMATLRSQGCRMLLPRARPSISTEVVALPCAPQI